MRKRLRRSPRLVAIWRGQLTLRVGPREHHSHGAEGGKQQPWHRGWETDLVNVDRQPHYFKGPSRPERRPGLQQWVDSIFPMIGTVGLAHDLP